MSSHNIAKHYILIITCSFDKTSNYMQNKYSDINFFRLNIDCFSEYKVCFAKKGFFIENSRGEVITTETCKAIYYRKPVPESLNDNIETKYHTFIQKEVFALIEGIVDSFEGITLSKPSKMRLAGNKIFQIPLAISVGFTVPDMCIGNNIEHIAIKEKRIVKPIAVGVIQNDYTKEYVQTNLFDSEIDLSTLKFCPSYFQEYIDKDYEVRITYIDKAGFAVRIDSANNVDWRKKGNNVQYSIIEIPESIDKKCLDFLDKSDMEFGCFDFIIKEDKWYFLELNTNGQWLWLEVETGHNISGEIVRYLNAI